MTDCFAITHVRIVDGTGQAPIPDGGILIEQGRITGIGPMETLRLPDNARQIQAPGQTALPALIDGHMHLGPEPGGLDLTGHLKANLQMVARLQKCLLWGTGTVGHAAGSPENIAARDMIRQGAITHCADPLIGGAITATCGHVRGRNADGPWEVRRAVREMIASGVDWIKTCASGGFQHDHEKLTHEDYTLEELQALTDMAHSRDRRVHVHAHAQPGLNNAIAAGCDVILHGALIDEAALEGIGRRNLYYMPTLFVTSEAFRANRNLPAYMTERMRQANPVHRAGVVLARKMGIRVVTGTDGGPGSIMHELAELVDCGFTPLQTLTLATRDTADALGVLDRVGTLETDKQADLFLVHGDPTINIGILANQQAITTIVKNGILVQAP